METALDVDGYIAARPDRFRGALRDLRATIQALVPEATEGISYGIPTFKLRGHPLVGLGAAKNHCSFYVMSVEALQAHAAEVAGFETGKGTVMFTPDAPLPDRIVASLVRTRIEQVDSRWPPVGGIR
jgi:uncharacterized protein YdhG (YjbR/CyaY superfamily)